MKILMVCLGNICRSPLAEGIMQSMISNQRLEWTVASAGTGSWHVGNPPHEGSINIAKSNGIDITQQQAQQFSASDFDSYDHILTMDAQNYQDVCAIASNEMQKKKVELLLNYASAGKNMAVPDPYYTGNFQEVYDLVHEACTAFVKKHANIT